MAAKESVRPYFTWMCCLVWFGSFFSHCLEVAKKDSYRDAHILHKNLQIMQLWIRYDPKTYKKAPKQLFGLIRLGHLF